MFHSYEVKFSLLSIVPLSCRLKIHCDFLFHYNFNISVCPLKVQKTKTEYGVRHVHSMKPKNWYPFCRMKTWSSMINSVGKHSNYFFEIPMLKRNWISICYFIRHCICYSGRVWEGMTKGIWFFYWFCEWNQRSHPG